MFVRARLQGRGQTGNIALVPQQGVAILRGDAGAGGWR